MFLWFLYLSLGNPTLFQKFHPIYCFSKHALSIYEESTRSSIRNSNTLATWCKEPTHWKRPLCWERLKAGGDRANRGWDGWMASLTQWMWVWASSRSWWWTGKPGVLQCLGSQRVRHDWVTELNWTEKLSYKVSSIINCFCKTRGQWHEEDHGWIWWQYIYDKQI